MKMRCPKSKVAECKRTSCGHFNPHDERVDCNDHCNHFADEPCCKPDAGEDEYNEIEMFI